MATSLPGLALNPAWATTSRGGTRCRAAAAAVTNRVGFLGSSPRASRVRVAIRCAATAADGPMRSYGKQSHDGSWMTSISGAKKLIASMKALARPPSRATKAVTPPRARAMSAMTRASKPSGAPVRSRRPSSLATFFSSWALGPSPSRATAGRSLGRVEGFEQGHDFVVELRRDRLAAEEPLVDVVVYLVHQRLEQVELGVGEGRGIVIRERPQKEVRFPEAASPGPQPDLLEPCVVHAEGADIEGVMGERQ